MRGDIIQCEMCGKETELVKAEIEGVVLDVCLQCAKFGKIIKKTVPVPAKKLVIKKIEKPLTPEEEILEEIVDDYSTIIRKKREELGIKQAELAKILSEKESTIAKIESGNFVPGLALAKKLEKKLKVKLIEERKIKKYKSEQTRSDTLTLGDVIKIKKK